MFRDLDTQGIPRALNHPDYKRDIYVGEAYVEKHLNNGLYQLAIHGGQKPSARPVFNMGENVFPTGIAVFAIVYNGEGFILGRMRSPSDEGKEDGEVKMDKSTTVGNEGDATLRAHANKDKDNTAEVRVSSGNVVSVRSTGATNITLHPHGELLRICCQRLLEYSDGYRIESGKVGGGANSMNMDTVTSQDYKAKVGPARVEVRVKNGKVDGSIVHKFAIADVVTTGGRTAGTQPFMWTIDKDGTWCITNIKKMYIGDRAVEPMVLGQQLTTFLTQQLSGIIRPHNMSLTIICTVLSMIINVLNAMTMIPPLTPLAGMITPINVQLQQGSAQVITAQGNIPALTTQYLTDMGVSKAGILSDFLGIQKIAPVTGIIVE